MTHGAGGLRWRALVVLTVAVLAVHWVALKPVDPVFAPGRTDRSADFKVRMVQPEPARTPTPTGVAIALLDSTPVPPAGTVHAAAPRVAARQTSGTTSSTAASTPPTADAAPGTLPGGLGTLQQASTTHAAPDVPVGQATGMPALPTHTLAVAVPGSATFHYRAQSRVRGTPAEGHAVLRWQQNGSGYDAVLEVVFPGRPTRTQRSTGAITAQGLSPLRYADRARTEEAAHFDRAAQRIVFSANRPEASLQPGAQDRLSVLLQLSAWAAGDPAAFAAGRSILVQTAGAREAPPWNFSIELTEMLDLPGGTVAALRLSRAPLHEHDGVLEVWLGPGPDYAPVRLRLTAPGGDWLDLQWSGTDRG